MKEPKTVPARHDEAGAVSRRLRRSAAQSLVQVHDRELRGILAHVSARRHARATPDPCTAGATSVGRSTGSPETVARAREEGGSRPTGAAGTLLELRHVSETVRILRVARPEGFRFAPGQYVKLGVPGGGRNPYTIASAPDEPHLEFCVEQAPGGRVSPALFALRAGDRVVLDAQAKGGFAIVPSARIHVMVATVTGIAPFRSMLRHAAHTNAWPGRFVVLHGASFADELAYRAELEDLASRCAAHVHYLPSVSRPDDPRNRAFPGATGRVSELVMRTLDEVGRTAAGVQVYACGNPQMVATVRRRMESLRVPVVTESFD